MCGFLVVAWDPRRNPRQSARVSAPAVREPQTCPRSRSEVVAIRVVRPTTSLVHARYYASWSSPALEAVQTRLHDGPPIPHPPLLLWCGLDFFSPFKAEYLRSFESRVQPQVHDRLLRPCWPIRGPDREMDMTLLGCTRDCTQEWCIVVQLQLLSDTPP